MTSHQKLFDKLTQNKHPNMLPKYNPTMDKYHQQQKQRQFQEDKDNIEPNPVKNQQQQLEYFRKYHPQKYQQYITQLQQQNQHYITQNQQSNSQSNSQLNPQNQSNPLNNMIDPDEIVENKPIDGMYVKRKKPDTPINKYLYCPDADQYLPVGYRYAGYHTGQNKTKTHMFTKRDSRTNCFVVHCQGNVTGQHGNYDIYQIIDVTDQLPKEMMQLVRDGGIIRM